MGRRTICSSELTKEIATRIENGLSNRDAVALSGITEATFYGWIKRGETEIGRLAESSRRKPLKKETPFVEFFEAIKRAIPKRKKTLIGIVKQAAIGGESYTETKKTYREVEKEDIDGKPYYVRILVEEIITEKTRGPEWTAAAWLLERLHYDEFGKRNRVDLYDWRGELKSLLETGAITAEEIENELGTSLAQEFFEQAGIHYVGVREAAEDS